MRSYFLHRWEQGVEPLLERLRIAHGTVPPTNPDEYCIIRWGKARLPAKGPHVLNPLEMTERTLSGTVWQQILQRGGQPAGCVTPPRRWIREYIVPVFHLTALSVWEKAGGPLLQGDVPPNRALRFRELQTPVRGYYANRAMREAVRAIYSLGLDFGVVHFGVQSDGQMAVTDVQPVPRLNARLASLFADAIHRFDEELQRESVRKTRVILGADPEFVLRDPKGEVVFASRFMGKSGKVGCDSIVLPDRSKLYPLAELRPSPASEPAELVRNLWTAMRMAAKIIHDRSLEWVAGGMPAGDMPLGGHIHFSGVWLNSRLLRVLDNYLALPLLMLEDESTGRRRPKYGFLGDFRRKAHGGFEYRTLPSWIVSPGIAAGVLSLARLLAEQYRHLPYLPLNSPEAQSAYYSGDKRQLLPMVRRVWGELEKLPGYERDRKFLNALRDKIFRMEGWREQDDFRPKWKLTAGKNRTGGGAASPAKSLGPAR